MRSSPLALYRNTSSRSELYTTRKWKKNAAFSWIGVVTSKCRTHSRHTATVTQPIVHTNKHSNTPRFMFIRILKNGLTCTRTQVIKLTQVSTQTFSPSKSGLGPLKIENIKMIFCRLWCNPATRTNPRGKKSAFKPQWVYVLLQAFLKRKRKV